MNRIQSQHDISEGLAYLLASDERLIPIAKVAGPVPLRLLPSGFVGLCDIVVSQHVSKASAKSSFRRLRDTVDPITPANLVAAGTSSLVAAGLTQAKQNTLTHLAEAIIAGELELDKLTEIPERDARQQLLRIKGIGPWTADVYLLLCAGHRDIFPAGDVALQHALRIGLGLSDQPAPPIVRDLAQPWSPWRGVAARLFWAYYAEVRTRKSRAKESEWAGK